MPNKYRAVKTTYNGRTYASKAESKWAMFYESELKAGRIKSIEYQPVVELLPRPNRVKYVADFLITWADGSVEWIDVKGMVLPAFILKKKMFAHFYPERKLTIVQ